ncbi:MAG: Fe2+-dependent dioxygenase [Casimicrobiaceae bacterium]
MLLHLAEVLKSDELMLVREWLTHARFVDGRLSAGAAAKRVKSNEELDGAAPALDRLNALVMAGLARNPVYRSGALPLHIAAPYYARYRPGMTYGEHLDDPIMGAGGVRYRSDVAITLFLNPPQAYDGGELVIQTAFGSQSVKLPAGDAVLYPAGCLHRVAPVTQGERLVAITWVQSLVRDPARRELLFGLHAAREKLLQTAPDATETAQVSAAYLNLIRMWSDI